MHGRSRTAECDNLQKHATCATQKRVGEKVHVVKKEKEIHKSLHERFLQPTSYSARSLIHRTTSGLQDYFVRIARPQLIPWCILGLVSC
ncbi:hypothetical protein PAHAL_9G570000 [Panicum hallii]|uniref:Uncharacterized protein n=1 Tax=Panicum hallii TaxID=206008 RepID=A0A2S3ITC0_9POAL|nr:hypothetical protein PAHAL_9G570000 [Panicum hallii]